MAEKNLNLVDVLDKGLRDTLEVRLDSISPDESKYYGATDKLRKYLSAKAEWLCCAYIQYVFLKTRKEFDQATEGDVAVMENVLGKVSALNMSLLEKKVTKQDQIAVLEEIGRLSSDELKSLLHPGTTSYDVLDTARAYLFRKSWFEVIRPEVCKSLKKLCDIADGTIDVLQVGRTHLQDTSPVLFGGSVAAYARRVAQRVEFCDSAFSSLKGKVSGIVGTGAGIEMVIGEGTSVKFEEEVLKKLDLEPDYAATQITQKEALADVGHGIATLMHVLEDMSEDMRMMYSSAIQEVTSRSGAARLGGSSADATKNNPIDWENMSGKAVVVESGMRVLYGMIQSDFQRDLRNSVMARYQPQAMLVQTYESFCRFNDSLDQLSVNVDKIKDNLQHVRDNPSEAMVAILRGEKWIHPKYGVGHDFVKEIGKKAKLSNSKLIDVALADPHFAVVYEGLSQNKKELLKGKLENYIGSAKTRALNNISYANKVAVSGLGR